MSGTNRQVQHVWAQDTNETKRTSSGNHSCEGGALYSYSTVIARIVSGVRDQRIALITTRTYSVTTGGKHMPRSYDLTMPVFYVDDVGNNYSGRIDHAANLAKMNEAYCSRRDGMMRKLRDYDDTYNNFEANGLKDLREIMANADNYATAFGITLDMAADPETDWQDILAANAARNTPEMVAKREKAAAKRAAKIEADKLKYAGDARGAWRDNAKLPADRYSRNRFGHSRLTCEDGGAMVRKIGDQLETSWGARVPLDHAIRAFAMLKFVRMHRPDGWTSNGKTISVGHFRINRIEPDGSFVAGCHKFYWPEIERFAKLIGVFEHGASTDIVETSAHAA